MALWGQMRMQLPQSMQRSGRMVARRPRTRMASVGQHLMQVVQPRQRFTSRTTECLMAMEPTHLTLSGPWFRRC